MTDREIEYVRAIVRWNEVVSEAIALSKTSFERDYWRSLLMGPTRSEEFLRTVK